MLIQRENGALVVVRQTDHMAQVARIAERWGNGQFPMPEHREETICAAALHDNGWREWEEHPTLMPQTGRPRNLGEIETPVHTAFYRTGVERVVAVDPYAGLLVSLHAAALYAGVDGWDPHTLRPPVEHGGDDVARAFLADQAALQQQLRTALADSPRFGPAMEPSRLWRAYLCLRAWDSLSLFFVFRGMADTSLDHVPSGGGEVSVTLRRVGTHAATADPWPFVRPELDVPVVVAFVPDRPYESGDDFLRVLAAAPLEVQVFSLHAPATSQEVGYL